MVTVDYRSGGVSLSTTSAWVVKVKPKILRARLSGMLFEPAKTMLLPSAMRGVRELVSLYKTWPSIKALVTGHTDTVGNADYNRGLSMERARSVKAFLTDDVQTWMAWYHAPGPCSDRWGRREDVLMLGELGFHDAATAVADFQRAQGMAPTGVADDQTRAAIISKYMALEGTSFPDGSRVESHGCGEWHLAVPTGDEVDEPKNRRVEVFLFTDEIKPRPTDLCAWNGCKEYEQWVEHTIKTIDLDDEPGVLTVKVDDPNGAAISGARVRVCGIVEVEASTDAEGLVHFDELIPGPYTIVATKDGYHLGTKDVLVPSATKAKEAQASKPSGGPQVNFLIGGGSGGDDPKGGPGYQEIRLQPDEIELRVIALDDAQQPIEGVEVKLPPLARAAKLTDRDGVAKFAAKIGHFSGTAAKAGFKSATFDVEITAGSTSPAIAQVVLLGDVTINVLVVAKVTCPDAPYRADDGPTVMQDARTAVIDQVTMSASGRHTIDGRAPHSSLVPGRSYSVEVNPRRGMAADDPGTFDPVTTSFVVTDDMIKASKRGRPSDVKVVVERTKMRLAGGENAARARIVAIAEHEASTWWAAGNKLAWPRIEEYVRVVFGNGAPAIRSVPTNPIGKPGGKDWCGIFATWCVWTGANPCVWWDIMGGRPNNLGAQILPTTPDERKQLRPGDVVKFMFTPTTEHPNDPNHHGIFVSMNDDPDPMIVTVEGNIADPNEMDKLGPPWGPEKWLCLRRRTERRLSSIHYFYRTVPDSY